jgi:hypothetical protein
MKYMLNIDLWDALLASSIVPQQNASSLAIGAAVESISLLGQSVLSLVLLRVELQENAAQ